MTRALLLALTLLAPPAFAGAADLYQASYDLETAQDYAGALAKVDQILATDPTDYVATLRRGWLLYLAGRYADAAEAYRAAVRLSPRSAEAQAGLALPLMALRRWSEAEAACREVLKLAPGNYLGMSRLAYVLYSAGRYAEAAQQYGAVLDLFPSDVEMRTGLGWALLKKGDATSARKAFQEVLRTAPSHVSARQGLDASS